MEEEYFKSYFINIYYQLNTHYLQEWNVKTAEKAFGWALFYEGYFNNHFVSIDSTINVARFTSTASSSKPKHAIPKDIIVLDDDEDDDIEATSMKEHNIKIDENKFKYLVHFHQDLSRTSGNPSSISSDVHVSSTSIEKSRDYHHKYSFKCTTSGYNLIDMIQQQLDAMRVKGASIDYHSTYNRVKVNQDSKNKQSDFDFLILFMIKYSRRWLLRSMLHSFYLPDSIRSWAVNKYQSEQGISPPNEDKITIVEQINTKQEDNDLEDSETKKRKRITEPLEIDSAQLKKAQAAMKQVNDAHEILLKNAKMRKGESSDEALRLQPKVIHANASARYLWQLFSASYENSNRVSKIKENVENELFEKTMKQKNITSIPVEMKIEAHKRMVLTLCIFVSFPTPERMLPSTISQNLKTWATELVFSEVIDGTVPDHVENIIELHASILARACNSCHRFCKSLFDAFQKRSYRNQIKSQSNEVKKRLDINMNNDEEIKYE